MGLTQVSTDGVKNDAITKTKIPANQIEASELADNAVDTNAIANNAVTAGKLASGVQTTINNNADDKVITGSGTANTLEGESSNYNFVGGTLRVKNSANDTQYGAIYGDATSFHLNGGSPNLLLYSAGGERLRIDSSGNTLIGTTTQNWKFQVFGGRSCFTDTSTYAIGVRKNSAQNSDKNFWIGAAAANDNTNPDLVFSNNIGTEKFRFKESGGLTFNGDTAAANALDDYEEGTWTPVYNTGSASSAMFDSCVYNDTGGFYTKIGNSVFFSFRIQTSSITNSKSGSHVIVNGLPFTSTSGSGSQGGAVFNYSQAICSSNNGYLPTLHIGASNVQISFFTCNGNAYTVGDGNNNFAHTLHIHGQYTTAT